MSYPRWLGLYTTKTVWWLGKEHTFNVFLFTYSLGNPKEKSIYHIRFDDHHWLIVLFIQIPSASYGLQA